MKPVIGVTSKIREEEYTVGSDNITSILMAGGIPVILPSSGENTEIDQILGRIDGLYMTGGEDVVPAYYGEEPHPLLGTVSPSRDQFEIAIARKALETGKPILGVCRGCQVMNVAAGGTLYQDIHSQMAGNLLQHAQKSPKGHGSHEVKVTKFSLLYRLTGEEKLLVNSRHHQAVRQAAPSFHISGQANDGIIEAIERSDHPFALGVQWHPENMAARHDLHSLKLYQGFIDACRENMRKER